MKKIIITITTIILLLAFSVQVLGETATSSTATRQTYTVNFYASKEDKDYMDSQTFELYEDVVIPITEASKIGYVFLGWQNSSVKEGLIFQPNKIYPSFTSTSGKIIDLYAAFRPNKYKINYHGNGADNDRVVTLNYTYDESYNYLKNPYIKDSYDFLSWNTKQDGTGISIEEGAYDINYYLVLPHIQMGYVKDNSIFDLYAQWGKHTVATPSNINTPGNTTNNSNNSPTPLVQSNNSITLSAKNENNSVTTNSNQTANTNSPQSQSQSPTQNPQISNNTRINNHTGTSNNNTRINNHTGTSNNITRLNNNTENNLLPVPPVTEPVPERDLNNPIQDNFTTERIGNRRGARRATILNDTIVSQNINPEDIAQVIDLIEPILEQEQEQEKPVNTTNNIKNNEVVRQTPAKNSNKSSSFISGFFNWMLSSPTKTAFCVSLFIILLTSPFIFFVILKKRKKE